METAIEVAGLRKSFGEDTGARRARSHRRAGRGARLPRPERLRQDDDDPDPARARPRGLRHRAAARRRPLARRRDAAPATRLRPGRRGAVAEPQRRRGDRPAGPAARRVRSPRRASLLERFELDPTKKGRTYSKGNRQKVALIAALASDVELLILDEPTEGLDPLMAAVFRSCIEEERRAGAHRAPREPHPGRGRGAVRPGDDHPCRPERWRAAPSPISATSPTPRSRPSSQARPPGWPSFAGVHNLQVEGSRVHCQVDADHARRGAAVPDERRRPQPGQPAADPGGALPAPLPRRRRRSRAAVRRRSAPTP